MSTEIPDCAIVLPAGYTARPLTPDDIDAVVTLRNAWSQVHYGEDHYTANELRIDLVRPEVDLEHDALVVHDSHGQLVAEIHIENISPHNAPRILACVHPAYRGRGIGRALVRWSDARVHASASRAPVGVEVVCQRGIATVDESAARLLKASGYTVARHFLSMLIKLTPEMAEYAWPSALTLRTFEGERDLLPTVRALDDVFCDHWGYVERPEPERIAMFRHFYLDPPDSDPRLYWLVLDGHEIAALNICTPTHENNPTLGYVAMLGVLRPYRRRGLAKALLRVAFAEYARRGYEAVELGVDAANLTGALRLYEQVGMHVHRQWDLYEKIIRPGRKLQRVTLDE